VDDHTLGGRKGIRELQAQHHYVDDACITYVHQQVANELMTTTAKEQFGSSCLCRRSPLRCDRLAAVSASRRRGALITLLMTLT
jgi:hypothetical protein